MKLVGSNQAVVLVVAMRDRLLSSRRYGTKAQRNQSSPVEVENISTRNGQTASDGSKWSFALSPGLWVLNSRQVPTRLPKESPLARASNRKPKMATLQGSLALW